MIIENYLEKRQSMLISCRPEDTVKSAATLLATNKIGAMPVVNDEGRLVGLLSERDIVRAFSMRNCNVLKMLVGELMSRNPVTCRSDDGMDRAM
jgi:CBS domain-containing protein